MRNDRVDRTTKILSLVFVWAGGVLMLVSSCFLWVGFIAQCVKIAVVFGWLP